MIWYIFHKIDVGPGQIIWYAKLIRLNVVGIVFFPHVLDKMHDNLALVYITFHKILEIKSCHSLHIAYWNIWIVYIVLGMCDLT